MPYQFNKAPEGPTFELPPAGDYEFLVTECLDAPILRESKNYVLAVKLALIWGQQKVPIFASPWARSENHPVQDGRDDIALFLLSLGLKPGNRVEWQSLVGKKGRCRIKHEAERDQAGKENQGRTFARVDYFFVPRQTRGAAMAPKTTATTSEFEKARQAQIAKSKGQEDPELDDINTDSPY